MENRKPPTRKKDEPSPITLPRCPDCRGGRTEAVKQLSLRLDGRTEWYCIDCCFSWYQ